MHVRNSPEMFVARFAGLKGLTVEDLKVAPVVVLSWNQEIVHSLADTIGAESSPGWATRYPDRCPLYSGKVGGQRVSIVHARVGAPNIVMQMEQLIVCVSRIFLGICHAGSLQHSAPVGTFLIPTDCVREEGTSAHYVDVDTPVGASLPLAEILQQCCQAEGVKVMSGRLWTTDAPLRETISKIEKYSKERVLGVDMETSAMYALGHFRGVQVCNLLIVSDELWGEWRIAFGSPELLKAEQIAEQVVLNWLSHLSVLEKHSAE